MRIQIEKNGNQYYQVYIGEVIEWTSTVASFNNQYFQVPCVVIKEEDKIYAVPLKQHLYDIEITILED